MSSLEQAYQVLFIIAILFFAIYIIFTLIRAVIGPKIADRIMAINMIGTMTIMIISILAVKMNETYLEDISVIYAMISFLAVVILSKVYMGVHRENLARHQKEDNQEKDTSVDANASISKVEEEIEQKGEIS